MPFNPILTAKLTRGDDRDRAPFFAGRKTEIQSFNHAVENAGDKDQAVFRIFQGPPGCGKTSLVNHLADTCADTAVFIRCDPSDLANAQALWARIDKTALDRGSSATRTGAFIAAAVGEHLGMRSAAAAVRGSLAEHSARNATLVLHLDEAHALDPENSAMLLKLHTTGIGVPCVMVLTGLGHTRSVVSAVRGLTRLARDATVDMDEMSDAECADSTLELLDAVGAVGTAAERVSQANLVGGLANRWPQHLHCAQVALCEELLRVHGVLRDADTERVRERSKAMRHDYYGLRLMDHPVFSIDRAVTKRALIALAIRDVRGKRALRDTCAREFKSADAMEWFDEHGVSPLRFADTLIEKGLVREKEGRWRAATPSMVDWAAREVGTPLPPKPREQAAGNLHH